MNVPNAADNHRECRVTFQIMMIVASDHIFVDFPIFKCLSFPFTYMKRNGN